MLLYGAASLVESREGNSSAIALRYSAVYLIKLGHVTVPILSPVVAGVFTQAVCVQLSVYDCGLSLFHQTAAQCFN